MRPFDKPAESISSGIVSDRCLKGSVSIPQQDADQAVVAVDVCTGVCNNYIAFIVPLNGPRVNSTV